MSTASFTSFSYFIRSLEALILYRAISDKLHVHDVAGRRDGVGNLYSTVCTNDRRVRWTTISYLQNSLHLFFEVKA